LPYPVYGSNGIIGYASEANADAGTIIIGRVGSYCGSLYLSNRRCWVTDNAIRGSALKDNDARFLFYLLSTLNLNNWRGGSGQPLLNQEILGQIPAAVPLPDEQRAIAGVLGTLDDKIKQNRRTAQALERLARAIFRAWFVDFEPVTAKAAGAASFPSMPQEVFDALPTRFVDSDLGPVPEGWEVGTLKDVLHERNERVSPSDETLRLPYVPIDCITAKRITLDAWKDGSEAKSSLIRFVPGDVLFGAMRPYFHKVCLAPFEGTTRTTCFVLTPRAENDMPFALMLASERSTIEYATNHSVGSTIPYAKWDNSLSEMSAVIPLKRFRAAFAAVVGDQFAYSQQLVGESRKLAEMRDYLLPRLLSGSVRVEVVNG